MSSLAPIDMRSRPGLGIIGLGLVLAFLAGLALATFLGRRQGWFAPQRPPVSLAQPGAASEQGTPSRATLPPPDLAMLAAREAALSAQLGALETRLPAITAEAAGAGAQAARAEALLLASAARRALDRGVPLGPLEEQLRRRFADNRAAVDAIAEAARAPVTLEDLRLGLDAIAPELQSGGPDGVGRALRRELGTLVVLRRTSSPSPLPAERVARARRLLDGGQVEAALAEAQKLPGAARARNWMAAARRYLRARQILDQLEAVALTRPATIADPANGPITSVGQ